VVAGAAVSVFVCLSFGQTDKPTRKYLGWEQSVLFCNMGDCNASLCLITSVLVVLIIAVLAYCHYYGGCFKGTTTGAAREPFGHSGRARCPICGASGNSGRDLGPPYPPGQNCCHVRDARFPHFGAYDITHIPPVVGAACPYGSPCPKGLTCHEDPERMFGYCA